MNNAKLLTISIIISIMAALAYMISSVNANKNIRTNFKFYPKRYIMPPRWMRKIFSLPKKEMPKFLFCRLLVSIAHIAIGIINAAILLINFSVSVFVVKCLIMFQMCWVLTDAVVFLVLLRKFNQRDT